VSAPAAEAAPDAHAARPPPPGSFAVSANAAAPPPTADTPPTPAFAQAEARLRGAGWPGLADILAQRVAQSRRKMKLSEEEAARACVELIEELPTMPDARQLLESMPKATIELVRSVRERGVAKRDAESMAEYLLQARTSLAMDNPGPFDENCSHVIGREWADIDYRDEGMTWQRQQAIYAPKGVSHFKDVANLQRFFRIESQAPYFRKLYRVQGTAP